MKARWFAALGVALVLATVGCKNRDKERELEDNQKRLTPESTDDATSPIVDEDYRFRLGWPGAGWKMMGEADARRANPDALAGLMHIEKRIWGVVMVEAMPGASLADLSQTFRDTIAAPGQKLESEADVVLAGHPAKRLVATGEVSGISFRYVYTLLVSHDHAYELVAWGMAGTPLESFSPVFDAFSLLDGPVTGRAARETSPDAEGIDWRVRSGTLEQAGDGLRVRAAPGFRFVTGGELETLSPGAELGLLRRAPELYVVVTSELASASEQAPLRDALRARLRQNPTVARELGEWKARWLGADVGFARFASTSPAIEFLQGSACASDRCYDLVSWYAAGSGDKARIELASALGGFETMPLAARDGLIRELSSRGHRQNVVGRDFALRRGVFRHFGARVTWTIPPGPWRLLVGDAARAAVPWALAVARNDRWGLTAILAAADGGSSTDTEHDRFVLLAGAVPDRRLEERRLGAEAARASEGTLQRDVGATRYRLLATAAAGRGYAVLVHGRAADLAAADSEVDALFAAVRIEPAIRPTELSPGGLVDHRVGFRLSLPSGPPLRDLTPAELAPVGTVAMAESGPKTIGVIALCMLADGQDEQWFMGLLEQVLRDKYAGVLRGKPSREDTTLAGLPARHVSWQAPGEHLHAFVLTRDRTTYALIAADGSGAAADEARAGFGLLP